MSTPVGIRQIGTYSRSPGSRGNRSLSIAAINIYPQLFSDNMITTTTTRCIIVTDKAYTYAGLFIRRILIGRATVFHIEKFFE
jgi:hypothetical protein